MKKIEAVHIKNFQSHEDTRVNFKDFTAIRGATNSGKSSIIRAIKFCLFNEPDGVRFIRKGKDTVEVTVFLDNDTSVKRVKGKENYYELFNGESMILRLEAFGKGPIEEVVSFHGMKESTFFGKSQILNILDQLSAPFFLSGTSSDRAKMVGKIAKTNIIDRAISNISSQIREKKSLRKQYENDIDEINENLQKYTDLPQLKAHTDEVFATKIKAEGLVSQISKLHVLKHELLNTSKTKKLLDENLYLLYSVDDDLKMIDKVLDIFNQASSIKAGLYSLTKLLKDKDITNEFLNSVTEESLLNEMTKIQIAMSEIKEVAGITNLEKTIRKDIDKLDSARHIMENLNIEDMEKDINRMEDCKSIIDNINSLRGARSEVIGTLDRKSKGDRMLSDYKEKCQGALSDYKKALLENPECPFCQSEIDKEKIQKISSLV
jgi:DNA repair protein SbcC/Rad50